MLNAYQCEVVAFDAGDGAVVCYDCVATSLNNDMYLHRILQGLDDHPHGWTPLIRYSIDERGYEDGWECDCPNCIDDNWHANPIDCDQCGREVE